MATLRPCMEHLQYEQNCMACQLSNQPMNPTEEIDELEEIITDLTNAKIVAVQTVQAESPLGEVDKDKANELLERLKAEAKQKLLTLLNEARVNEEILTLKWVLNQFTFADAETDVAYIEKRIADLTKGNK